jgi:tetratricopeptide (TPR) repeat protein
MTALIALTALAAGSAQAATPSPERLAAIWSAAEDRVVTQLDAWFEEGDYPKCIQLLRIQAEMSPSDYDVATNLGWMHENVQDYDKATEAYEAYRQRNPQDDDAALALGEFYFRRKQYADVIPLMEPAIKRKPHPNAFRILAHAYEKTGKLAESKRVWDTYIARAPDDLTAKANLRRVEGKIAAK